MWPITRRKIRQMMESAKTLKSYYKYAQYAEGVNGNMNIIHKESIKKSPNGT